MMRKRKTSTKAETILLDAYYVTERIAYLRDRLEELESRRTSITRTYGYDSVQSSPKPDKLLTSIAQIDELRAKTDEQLTHETEKETHAERLIMVLGSEDERSILRRMYLSRESINEIAYHMNLSVKTVYNIKYKAINKLNEHLEKVGDV